MLKGPLLRILCSLASLGVFRRATEGMTEPDPARGQPTDYLIDMQKAVAF